MRVLISADMEGATGVTWPADVEPGTEQGQRCRRMFTAGGSGEAAGFTVDIEVDAAQLDQAAAIVPTVRRTGDRTVSYHSPTAWDTIRCFKTVTTMIATEDNYG